ncbi:uncharacterized protein RAG0_17131 [Rhynchosporium agropyri]|uniref:Uncharacterized protein n=1 Tax=Rhynchosporium agropyri TaxID=914238 RepID=A0A1E1LT13_9HELO|nr:uncharacterized protein RAG0_17131 [Rhynchosporium agropyri]
MVSSVIAAAVPAALLPGDVSIVKRESRKQCTVGKFVECTYKAYCPNNNQVRCAVSTHWAFLYSFGECPDMWGGNGIDPSPLVRTDCIPNGEYDHRLHCDHPKDLCKS